MSTTAFHPGQLVKARGKATFIILGFRVLDEVPMAQLKEVDLERGIWYRGELALPVSSLKEV